MNLPPLPSGIHPLLSYWNEDGEIIAITRDLDHVMFFKLRSTEKEWEAMSRHQVIKMNFA